MEIYNNITMGVWGGVFPIHYNITSGEVSQRTPNLHYLIYGRPLIGMIGKYFLYISKHWHTLCLFAACLSACLLMTNLSDSGSDSVIPVFAVWKLIKGAHNACKNYQESPQCL